MNARDTRHRLWIDGKWLEGPSTAEILSPWSGDAVARADQASGAQMEQALAAAARAQHTYGRISRYTRSRLLAEIARGLQEHRSEIVQSLVQEAGKPLALADAEVGRAIVTFTVASEEAKRFGGEIVPLDIEPAGRAYAPATSYWVPRGVALGVTPFNFPINLVAHKVAPALAAGSVILIKSAPQAPGGAAWLARIFEKAATTVSDSRDAVPLAALQVLSCSNEVASVAVKDPRVQTVSFTGSTRVGWILQQQAVGKRTLLELGGNAAVIVHSDADLARAASRCAFGGFSYAGQTCISVQRIFVQKEVAARFQTLLVGEVQKLVSGDPAAKDTFNGPLIDDAAASRVMNWIDEAVKGGARILTGGKRERNVVTPTVLADVKPEMKVSCEEVFGPLVVLSTYDRFEDAIAQVNDSRFGLQAGVFTESARLQQEAVRGLEVGGVILNEVPTYRADQMPYGGVKESGIGREGVRYAMEEYSERRVVVQWVG